MKSDPFFREWFRHVKLDHLMVLWYPAEKSLLFNFTCSVPLSLFTVWIVLLWLCPNFFLDSVRPFPLSHVIPSRFCFSFLYFDSTLLFAMLYCSIIFLFDFFFFLQFIFLWIGISFYIPIIFCSLWNFFFCLSCSF